MAEKVGEIYYDVTLELDQMIKDQRRAQQHVDKTADSLQRLAPIAAAAKAALSGLAVMKIIDMADEWGQYASRIKQATKSTEEYTYVQERMLASANATFRSVQETRESFIQLSPVLREMGLSLGQSVDVIDTFSGLLVVNAASAEKAKGAQDALAKSLQKGKIDADAWMSIYSTLDSVVDIIAESSGKSGEEIRKLGAEGKLGVDMFVNALSDGSSKVAAQVKEMPTTVRDAMQSVVNGLQEYVGWSNQANGITATIASAVSSLGENFNGLANVALVAVGAGLVRYVAGTTAAAIATAAKTAAAMKSAAAEVALAQAEAAQTAVALAKIRALSAVTANTTQVTAATLAYEAATKRLAAAQAAQTAAGAAMGGALRGLLAFLTGPAGIAIAAGIAAASIFSLGDNASKAVPKVDELTASIGELTKAQLENQRNKAADGIAQLTQKAREANSAVVALERDQAALNKQFQEGRGGIDAKGLENVNRSLTEARANADAATKELQAMINADYKLAEAQKQRETTPSAATRVTRSDPEVQKRLDGMRDELELAKLTGAAKARLQAIQKLGENATAAERAEAEKLATSIYNLEEAQKKLKETAKAEKYDGASYLPKLAADVASERDKISIEEEKQLRDNDKHLKAKEISVSQHAQAVKLIREKAAKDRSAIDQREAADALMVSNAELAARRQLQAEIARQDAEIAGAAMGDRARDEMDQRLQLVQQFAQRAQQIEDQRRTAVAQADEKDRARIGKLYDEVLQIERAYQGQSLAAYDAYVQRKRGADETWANGANRAWQNFIESSRDAASQAQSLTEKAFQGMEDALTSFAMTGKLNFKNMAESIISDLIRIQIRASMVQALGGSSGGGGLFSTLISSATAMLGGWQSAGTQASGAVTAGVSGWGNVSSTALPALAGGRANGGDVSAGKMYEVNERGTPEVLTVGNKQLLMMAGQSGNVTPLDTGRVNVAAVPSPEGRGGGATAIINMKFIGAPSQPEVKQTQGAAGQIDVEVIFKQLDNRAADGIARGSSAQYRATKQRFRLQD